ncbi:MAG: phosphoenolpyruvate synthase [Chloroflexota bacterium]
MTAFIRWFDELTRTDVAIAGGKGANLGEMVRAGLPVPPGFVVVAAAYQSFLIETGLADELARQVSLVDVNNRESLERTAAIIQASILQARIPANIQSAVIDGYRELSRRTGVTDQLVAVRSSATLEDTETASFAGMNRSFLNVRGAEDLLDRMRSVWASLFSPRVIFYRKRLQLDREPEIAVIVQSMVNSAKSGVAFSVNPSTGNRESMVIEAAFGLGEVVVGGQVEPDHYVLLKRDLSVVDRRIGKKAFMLTRNPSGATMREDLPPERATEVVLTDDELQSIAKLVLQDEAHYGTPQDIEWAIGDGGTYLVQSRPVTTKLATPPPISEASPAAQVELVRGIGSSPGRVSGAVRIVINTADTDRIGPGDILVTGMTSPDWVPFVRRAGAIVTDSGGMTSHAAIVSRELGLPCIVGTRQATSVLRDGDIVTVDGGLGVVFAGAEPILATEASPPRPARDGNGVLVTATRLLVNLAEPERAQDIAQQHVDGVGLLRAEFMILNALDGKHPRKLIEDGRADYIVQRLTEQLTCFAQPFSPRPVVYRAMDFRTNEFRGLEGGERFEPHEENPMIGYRGAFRYVQEPDLFRLELEVLKRVRSSYGNLHLMIPFVRTLSEFQSCKRLIDESGLTDQPGFELWIMAEVPSVVHWLDAYARTGITGVSIGSNDLTQLVLGVDRDNATLASLFDERDHAVTATIKAIITGCGKLGLRSSICGQAPSVYPDYAEMLVRFGIDSISVNPDAIEQARYNIAAAEQRLILEQARSHAQPSGG